MQDPQGIYHHCNVNTCILSSECLVKSLHLHTHRARYQGYSSCLGQIKLVKISVQVSRIPVIMAKDWCILIIHFMLPLWRTCPIYTMDATFGQVLENLNVEPQPNISRLPYLHTFHMVATLQHITTQDKQIYIYAAFA